MSKHQDFQMFGLKLLQIIMTNFNPLEVVGRASEIQLQVGDFFGFNPLTAGAAYIQVFIFY